MVIPEATRIERVGTIQKANLAKHRVTIDEHTVPNPQVVISQPSRTGDVNEEIAMAKPLTRDRFARTVELSIGAIPVNPRVSKVKISKDLVQGFEGKSTVMGDGANLGVVGPSSGILEVKNLMSKRTESKEVLDIVPDDTAKRVLTDQSSNNNPHGGTLEDFQTMHSPHPCGLSWVRE